jgi:hypothetical protein
VIHGDEDQLIAQRKRGVGQAETYSDRGGDTAHFEGTKRREDTKGAPSTASPFSSHDPMGKFDLQAWRHASRISPAIDSALKRARISPSQLKRV